MIIPVGYAQANLRFSGSGLPNGAEVTFGVVNEEQANPVTVASAIATAWTQEIKALQATNVTLDEVLVKNGPNTSGAAGVWGVQEAGTLPLGDVIPSCALLVSKNTTLGGRHGRGRNFWPIIGEDAISNGGTIVSNALTNLQVAFTNFLGRLNTAGHPMVLLHGDALTEPVEVTSLTVSGTVGSQRRRLRR